MMSLQELQKLPRVYIGTPNSVYYYLTGWKGCRNCKHLIQWKERKCPDCGKLLSSRPRGAKGARKLHELVSDTVKRMAYIEKIEKQKSTDKSCSKCGSRDPKHYRKYTNGVYAIWLHDGKGGYLCYSCNRKK